MMTKIFNFCQNINWNLIYYLPKTQKFSKNYFFLKNDKKIVPFIKNCHKLILYSSKIEEYFTEIEEKFLG